MSTTAQQPTVNDLGRVHLLGIGGVGVSAVARLLLAEGVSVSGTDAKDLPVLDQLRAAGATVYVGFDADHVRDADTLVVSSVIQAGNPELEEAKRRGLPVLHRSQALAALMRGRVGVTVAGTHGKTTTSSMIAVMLRHAGLEPTFAIGAPIPDLGTNAELGQGSAFVAEADESDGSFLNYTPSIAIVTNVEADHLDHYGTAQAVHQAFDRYADLLPATGLLVACSDDEGAAGTASTLEQHRADVRVVRYGFGDAAQLRLSAADHSGLTSTATLRDAEGSEHLLSLHVPGDHNLLNAAAAYAVGRELGLTPRAALDGLAAFGGAARRFEFGGTADGVRVYDDYAHHPTEVRAALRAARDVAGQGKVHVLFQPHLFTRTRDFAQEFGEALSLADSVQLLPIYPAREEPIPGVTSELVAASVSANHAVVAPAGAAAAVVAAAKEGDVIMTIGAGDVTAFGAPILEQLRTRAAAR
ncbi:UDP-N-acetylmuramate--L-alanine ligase [Galactobacter caseinivorans]|uniref:UDP-N-acetylmuramate--L-alanine ligase n=1 Tax=Galactobacter caseinivorans TaxID=2676123 RepID=A0A496PMB3_9MICC|nr:UDP-N-acetylmuramate--L-alanine ligase [Galactobacter caseinivorans]RKW71665.1 UDP-N-acetylmuramate--L-alanine ligase [Galactobacter caseinivorans]